MTIPRQALIRSTFERAVSDPAAFATCFKTRLFQRDPTLRRLFPIGQDLKDGTVIEMLSAAVEALSDDAQLARFADHLASRLYRAQIQPRHYGTIGQALLDTLMIELGATFTEEVHDAWADGYVRVAEAVMAARYNPMELVA